MGLYGIAEVKMVKDNWNVEWKIEDETIAKCVPESGIENNELEMKSLTIDQDYYFAVEAFNENGVSLPSETKYVE